MSLGLLGAYYSSSSESDEECDKDNKTKEVKATEEPNTQPKLANPFMKDASKSLKPSYMVQTEDFSASKQVNSKILTLHNRIIISHSFDIF